METLVLCPEELCLGPVRLTASNIVGLAPPTASDFSIWTSGDLEKGTRFVPWKGTVRSDKLPVHEKLPEFDIRHRFGLYDEISEVSPGRRLRQCNWIRFLRYSLVYNEEVNVIGTKGPTGEPIFDLIKDVGPKTELVAFFVPERPEEAFLLPAIQYLRTTLFKRLIDNVLEESPLDLSTSLVMSKVFPTSSPANSLIDGPHMEGRKSVSSDCTTSTNDGNVNDSRPRALMEAFQFRAAAAAAAAFRQSEAEHQNQTAQAKLTEIIQPQSRNHHHHHRTSSNQINNNNNIGPVNTKPQATQASSQPASQPVQRRREKNMLPCNYCGKCFDRPSLLKRHIRIHTGERPHVCDICNKGFSTSSSLNTHRRIHSGEKPHQCGVCGKRFTASSNLYYHKMTHVKEKPHKCTMCSKSFPTPGDLKSHTYVHTGTWPFKCHICQRGFSKQTNLKNHLLLHSGDKPFSCDICQKKFALSCNLRAHLKTHEAEYQSSATSLALYRRALAALGGGSSSPDSSRQSPQNPPESPELAEEDHEEDHIDERSSEHSNPSSPKLPNAFPRMTVTV